jgi:gamma-glutamyltranspeptidase / glutathione hydrolase
MSFPSPSSVPGARKLLRALALALGTCSLLACGALSVQNDADSAKGASTSSTPSLRFVFVPGMNTDSPQLKDKAAQRFAVATANPLPTQAAYQVLKAGGSAVDAAIAAQMVLSLVEPQSSGIGGGAFLLHQHGPKIEAFDGRETAPSAATENLFLKADGKPMAFADAVAGGRSVGVPGAIKMLELAHRRYGKVVWADLFAPAIYWAEKGFPISPRLHTQLQAELKNGARLRQDPVAAAYFFDAEGQPKKVGERLSNPELASTLRALAAQGSQALHQGEIAQAVVDKVRQHPGNPGMLSLADLSSYQPKLREALCFDYVAGKTYQVCGFPPPSSGALAMGQILGILAHVQTSKNAAPLKLVDGLPSSDWLHDYTEASRLAFADRALYVADPDFVQAPAKGWQSMLSSPYLAQRASLIGLQSMKSAKPGDLPSQAAEVNPALQGIHITDTLARVASPDVAAPSARLATAHASLKPWPYAAMPAQPEYGTSHLSIVDSYGNALAMTTTIEDVFGARLMVKGFLLNNELTDFSFAPRDATGKPIANRVEPGKRPRSSMSPTLVFDKDSKALLMSLGSPGGANIIHYTTKTLYGIVNWGLSPQQAINLPNFSSLNGPTLLEENRFPAATVEALKARGHEVQLSPNLVSGLQALQKTPQGWVGGADPRREGIVLGD